MYPEGSEDPNDLCCLIKKFIVISIADSQLRSFSAGFVKKVPSRNVLILELDKKLLQRFSLMKSGIQ